MGEALAYLLTWTTYGTWLPGDARGWVDRQRRHGEVVEPPDESREARARERMTQSAVILDATARLTVGKAIRATCVYRGWTVHALEVRSNHVHTVVTAGGVAPGEVMRVLKSYASRALTALQSLGPRKHWWTRDGSKRYVNTEESLHAAVKYVQSQDTSNEQGSNGG
jgi:REP element-mobilizing transposase RayT